MQDFDRAEGFAHVANINRSHRSSQRWLHPSYATTTHDRRHLGIGQSVDCNTNNSRVPGGIDSARTMSAFSPVALAGDLVQGADVLCKPGCTPGGDPMR